MEKTGHSLNELMEMNPNTLFELLYEGALSFVELACRGMEENRADDRDRGLQKATAIIAELKSWIDFDFAPEAAQVFVESYDEILETLEDAQNSWSSSELGGVKDTLQALASQSSEMQFSK